MWELTADQLRTMPEWTAVQALWRRAFGLSSDRELPCAGRYFVRKRRGVVVSMCRVTNDELWDVCTHEDWRNQGHATAVCQRAVEWASERQVTLLAVTASQRLGRWYQLMGCTAGVYV